MSTVSKLNVKKKLSNKSLPSVWNTTESNSVRTQKKQKEASPKGRDAKRPSTVNKRKKIDSKEVMENGVKHYQYTYEVDTGKNSKRIEHVKVHNEYNKAREYNEETDRLKVLRIIKKYFTDKDIKLDSFQNRTSYLSEHTNNLKKLIKDELNIKLNGPQIKDIIVTNLINKKVTKSTQ